VRQSQAGRAAYLVNLADIFDPYGNATNYPTKHSNDFFSPIDMVESAKMTEISRTESTADLEK
jgi:hypothetical protein